MTTPASRRDRLLCALEVAAVALLLAAQIWLVWEWLPNGAAAQRAVRIAMVVLLVAVIVESFLRVRDSRADLGLTAAHMKAGWGSIAVFTAIAFIMLVVTAFLFHGITLSDVNPNWLFTYTHGMLGQQLALQWLLNNRVHRALGGINEPSRTTLTVMLCVVVFTMLHAPNPGLMLSVAPAGAFWCWHFRRFHNLPALLVSHLLLGGTAMMLLGDTLLLRLRVGPPADIGRGRGAADRTRRW